MDANGKKTGNSKNGGEQLTFCSFCSILDRVCLRGRFFNSRGEPKSLELFSQFTAIGVMQEFLRKGVISEENARTLTMEIEESLPSE